MNRFKVHLDVTKAYARKDEETGQTKRYISGLASGTNLDLEDERMAESAILAFKRAIEEGMFLHDGQWSLIPLRTGHGDEWHEILGWIVKAEIDEHWNLYIEAELDPTSPIATGLYDKLTRPVERGKPLQLGLSVGGYVVTAGEEWDETLQRYVRVYYEVKLDEVSVVSRPANPKTYLYAMAKSVPWEKVKGRTVLVSERDMEDELITKNADAEVTEEVAKSEEVVAADATVTEEVEKAEIVEEAVEEQVEKTDASDDAVAEEVEKAVEAEEVAEGEQEGAEVSKDTDPIAALAAQMAELTKMFAGISGIVAGLTKAEVEEVTEVVVEKSVEIEEQVEETDASVEKAVEDAPAAEATPLIEVEKGEQVDLTALMASIVEEAVSKAIAPLQARIEELESEPVDKSIAVRMDGEQDPLEVYKSEAPTITDRREKLKRALVLAQG